MIIQNKDGSLVDARTGAKWVAVPFLADRKLNVILIAPVSSFERILYTGDEASCRVFLDVLAVELDAVKWIPEKRHFEPVRPSGVDDG